jgi:hypothetical protein
MAQPLTKFDRTGQRYRRPDAIERAIDDSVGLPLDAVRARAGLSAARAERLSLEVLLHLVRAAVRRREQRTLSVLVPLLLTRCEAILRKKIPDGSLPNAEEVREVVVQRFTMLLAEDGAADSTTELDYFECRFLHAFRVMQIQAVRTARREARRLAPEPPPVAADDSAAEPTDEEILARLHEACRSAPHQHDDAERGEIARAIDLLPEPQRDAVSLVYLQGMPEDSKNPDELTAAKVCKVTGRTIRNRLREGIETLRQVLKEKS